MIKTYRSIPATATGDTTTFGQTTGTSGDAALVILRWHRTSAWAWMSHGQGPESRFAGFIHLPDPAALPARITALGWELLAVRERQRGLFEAEIRIPLPVRRPTHRRTA